MENVVFDRKVLILSATHSFLRFSHTLLWLRSTLAFYGRRGMKLWGTSNQRYHRLVALTSALQDNQDKHWKWRHPSRNITLLTLMGSPKSGSPSFCGIIWIVDWPKLILRFYTSLQTCSPAATRLQEIRRWFSCMSLFICKIQESRTLKSLCCMYVCNGITHRRPSQVFLELKKVSIWQLTLKYIVWNFQNT